MTGIRTCTNPGPPILSCLALREGDVPRLGGDPLQPGAHRQEPTEVEAALVGDVGVGVEGYVRHRVASADKEVVAREVPLHDVQRVVAEPAFGLKGEPAFLGHLQAEDVDPGAGHGDVRLVAVLLDVPTFFTETFPCPSSNPPNPPVTLAIPPADMTTLRRIIL